MDFTPLAPKASASANFATPAYIFWSFDFARVRPEGDSPSPLVAPVALLGLGTSSLNFSTEKLSLPRPTVSSRARPLFESLQKQINLLLLAVSLRGPPRGIRSRVTKSFARKIRKSQSTLDPASLASQTRHRSGLRIPTEANKFASSGRTALRSAQRDSNPRPFA